MAKKKKPDDFVIRKLVAGGWERDLGPWLQISIPPFSRKQSHSPADRICLHLIFGVWEMMVKDKAVTPGNGD